MDKKFRIFTWINIVFVFLVILAGGIVRTTHSGMGCPDWPTCFGMWIPPVNEAQLPLDFEKYLSLQDIDHTFNVYHTWVEYINRLLGALLGLLILIHFVWAFLKYRATNKVVVILSFLWLLAVIFTGWLGKVVVNENLAVSKISVHMISAIILVFIPMTLLSITKPIIQIRVTTFTKTIGLLFFVVCVLQMFLGINVRQEVDVIAKDMNYEGRSAWVGNLTNLFYIHRTSSWLVLLGSLGLLYLELGSVYRRLVFFTIGNILLLFILGVIFIYADFPAWAQPIHLVLGILLVTLSYFGFISMFKANKVVGK